MMKYLATTLCLLISVAQAAPRYLQIIHTNDLHSYLNGHADGRGGYDKIKTIIDDLKQKALARTDLQEGGVQSLYLDAGDFGEGTSFFLVDEGKTSFASLNELGVDAAVIGNHDHMLGIETLQKQIKGSREGYAKTAKILSANMVILQDKRLKGYIDSSATFQIDGLNISVIGLSTAEAHFQYPILPSFIQPPIPVGQELSKLAHQNGADLVVALTHIGTKTDTKLAQKSEFIDVIVGGHSHDRYDQPLVFKNTKGRSVPVVQTGAHGLAVGSMLLKINGPSDVEVVDYKLVDVVATTPKDANVTEYIHKAIEKRNEYFNGHWNDVVGKSEIKLTGYEEGRPVLKTSCWGKHQARMVREAVDADIGIHMANFQGVVKEPGTITFGDLVDNYPHFSSYGDEGWNLSRFEADGKFIKAFIRILVNIPDQVGIDVDGITWKKIVFPKFIPWIGGRVFAYGFKVDGEKMEKNKRYSLALPSEIGKVLKILVQDKIKYVFPEFEISENTFYWQVMENYVRANSPIRCLAD